MEKKLNLRKNILFNHKIISAKYLERKNLWQIKTNKKKVLFCKYLICAVGSFANLKQISAPIPFPPPVTMATLFSNFICIFSFRVE